MAEERESAFGDFDNDRDIDVLVSINDVPQLLRCDQSAKTIGVKLNRPGIQHDLRVPFGPGKAHSGEIEVHSPSEIVDRLSATAEPGFQSG